MPRRVVSVWYITVTLNYHYISIKFFALGVSDVASYNETEAAIFPMQNLLPERFRFLK